MNRRSLKPLKAKLIRLKKSLKKAGKYRLANEAAALISSAPEYKVLFLGDKPLGVYLAEQLDEFSADRLAELLTPYSECLENSDFSSLSWQIRYSLIFKAAENESGDLFYSAADIDYGAVSDRLNPLHLCFSEDEAYRLSTDETRAILRSRTERLSAETEIPEKQLCREYMKTAKNEEISVCNVIERDFRRVFPKIKPELYITAIFVFTAVLCLIIGSFSDALIGLTFFIPAFSVVKTLADHILMHNAEIIPALRYTDEEVKKHKIVCALSVLAGSPENITDGINKLKEAKIKNPSENIEYCLLCDLPPSKEQETKEDSAVISAVSDFEGFSVLIRNRSFSKTQGLYQGRERKRGAIDDLVRFISGENVGFRLVRGNPYSFKNAEFICTLDYDTIPFMGSINGLAAAALHPVNKEFGIITPRITTSLSSSYRTGISRLRNGNGGCCGVSAYDSADTELYSFFFREGTFTGKGLIRVKDYYEKISGKLPDEKVLSHDIIEGGILKTLYCGEIEFNDSFPPTTKGFFRRNHRWLRGDLQNWFFIFDKRLSPLTKFKLFDNIRRCLLPIYALLILFMSAAKGLYFPAAAAVLSLVLPYLPGLAYAALNGFGFSNTREFYSPFLSLSRTLVSRLFAEIIFLGRNAVLSLDAVIRTAARTITGKNLLEWQTAGSLDRLSAIGYGGLILPELFALLLFSVSVYFGNIFTAIAALLMLTALPASIALDKPLKTETEKIKEKDRKLLMGEVKKQWRFFEDYVTAEEHFLPPDNVQYTPVYRVARRTSPTNIGMYLLSCVSMAELSVIDRETAVTYISRTMETVEGLKKYNGNLYNWYSTETLEPLGGFVSSVDSGNFACCLTAVKEWLGKSAEGKRAERILSEIRLDIFYNKARNLFSTGIDSENGRLAKNCYDMLMSEARMMSYLAIARGQAPIKHWRALSRTMSKSGKYAGPVAWTGTMFEFFMPELLLASEKGSLTYEALKYAVYCQKERGKRRNQPFGTSESAYFSFDRRLNYLYKAHGVQALALCGGMDREYVVSPYSSFIALSCGFNACVSNIGRLLRDGFSHEKYGLYEAVDYTDFRTGGKSAAVRSHMAHHIGMSIAGTANALKGGVLRKLFLSDDEMNGARELLEERVMSGEKIINIEKIRDKEQPREQLEEGRVFSALRPEMNIIANRRLSLFITDTGLYYGKFGEVSVAVKSPDFQKRPKGMFFGIKDGEREIPFFLTEYDKGESLERSVVFGENHSEYYVNSAELRCGMKISLYGENAAEIREFAVENLSGYEKNINLAIYAEPCLMDDKAYSAHPAFADLFLKTEYIPEENAIIAYRKSRDSDRRIYMLIGFKEAADFNFSFSREDVNDYNSPLSFISRAGRGINVKGSVPSPALFIDLPVKIKAGDVFNSELFICYGESENEVVGLCRSIRSGREEKEPVSPLPKTTLQGQIARKILPAVIYGNALPEEILTAETELPRTALKRFGISGNLPLLYYRYDRDKLNSEGTILTLSGLYDCGLKAELLITCKSAAERQYISGMLGDYENIASVITEKSLSKEEKSLILRHSAFIFGKSEIIKPPHKLYEIIPCEMLKAKAAEGFCDDSFVINKKGHPLCNVLASKEFGTIVSQNSLGFTYALNSRENKLTPWHNDILNDNSGEMLLLKDGGGYYDLIAGAQAVFAPDKADYYGSHKTLEITSSVRVYKKGMGKELTVTVKNTSPRERQAVISYYTEPLLGADNELSCLKFSSDENTIFVKNINNGDYKGEMALYCNRESLKTTDREGFFAGEQKSVIRPYGKSCAALTVKLKIKSGEAETVRFIMSFSKGDSKKQVEAFKNVKTDFEKQLAPVIKSSFPQLNKLYSYWLPWQALGCRMWARSGFYQNGGAFGFRDQLQDSMAAVHFLPKEAKRQILNCCASQFTEGDVFHWWHKTDHGRKGVRTKCSDDLLWLPYVTAYYVKNTGDSNILSLNVHYISGETLDSQQEKYLEGKTTDVRENVYMHCKKALEKGFQKGGKELIKIGGGDWNDGYNRVGIDGRGESVWLSMFYVLAVKEFAPLAREMQDTEYADELEKRAAQLTGAITENGFENGYFIRAFYDDGQKMGAMDSEYCKIDLLPQAFSTLADIPDEEKRKSALEAAYRQLADEQNRIVKLFTPAFAAESKTDPGYVKSYPEGVRENGGQYTHGAVWLALAFLRNGDRETALRLADWLNPAKRGEAFKNEPYFMTADIYTNPDCTGRGGWSIYTGSAAWYYLLLGELYN